MSAVREDGPTPGARVTWSTTVPPDCVASVTVEFRTNSSGSVLSVVRSYTTTNTSETEVIQTGLQCNTTYYIRVVVTGVASLGNLSSNQVQVHVGGKHSVLYNCVVCMQLIVTAVTEWCYDISQIYQTQSIWLLKPLQTTQVSECCGSGHIRVCSCVLVVLELTTDLREAL